MSTASKIGVGLAGLIALLVVGLELDWQIGSGREARAGARVQAKLDNHKQEWAQCEDVFRQAEAHNVRSLRALEAGDLDEAAAEFNNNKRTTESWFQCDYEFKNKVEQEVKGAGLSDAYTQQVWIKWLHQNEGLAQQAGSKSSAEVEAADAQLEIMIGRRYWGDKVAFVLAGFIMRESRGLMARRRFQRLSSKSSTQQGLSNP
jgi:hypothetical protein